MKPRIRTVPPRVTTLAIAGAAAFALLPGVANAAVSSTFANGTLTVTSDDAGDNITLGVAGANITAPGVNNVPNDGSVNLVVNAAGGNDTINVSAPTFAGAPVINAGDGDDTITDTPRTDVIDGGNGNDRITAGRNTVATDPETIHGGAGNDVIIWNNGDGDDINEGDAGVDETLILEGTADDGNTITQEGTTTRFERTSGAGGFKVFSTNTMEKLSLQSFSGNDSVTTGAGVPIAMSIDSGPGNDTIATGNGPDRLLGDRGDDTLSGGGGDDTIVWTNGDGNDVMNGDAGFDTIENDLGNADDVSNFKVENGRIRYDRINGPFNLSVATAEVFELNQFGGNDTMTVEPGVTIPIVAAGGSGNDILRGGAGNDVLDGGDGDDTIEMRDGQADFAKGGAGNDSAVADAATIDAVADVESVNRPAADPGPGTPPALPAGVAALPKTAKVSKGVASIKVSCPAGTAGCSGSLALFSTKTIKAGKLKAKLELGRKSFAIGAGQSATVKVKLASGTAKLAKKKKLAVTARVGEKTSKLTLSF
jgi:Ca2+-binding RTX toxin-like protein